ncbi:Arm DNA-binding domain-containing protein [Gluconobacter japonicus]|uniref:Arm DNA-binding domain-containing protein n=1 Tax=Gluconobacter japonicus TaxID=376620 RepID=UPI0038CFE271
MPCARLDLKNRHISISDAQGPYLLVMSNDAKLWRLKYRFGGKEKTLSFGGYPGVSLLNARKAKEVAREEL